MTNDGGFVFKDGNISAGEPKKYHFLFEGSASQELMCIGRCSKGNFYFVTCEEFKAAEILGEMDCKAVPFPRDIIIDNIVDETDDLVIVNLINVKVEDIKKQL